MISRADQSEPSCCPAWRRKGVVAVGSAGRRGTNVGRLGLVRLELGSGVHPSRLAGYNEAEAREMQQRVSSVSGGGRRWRDGRRRRSLRRGWLEQGVWLSPAVRPCRVMFQPCPWLTQRGERRVSRGGANRRSAAPELGLWQAAERVVEVAR